MSTTVQLPQPPVQNPEKLRKRRRRAFWRKFLFCLCALAIIGFAGFCGYFRMTPAEGITALCKGMRFGAFALANKINPIPPFGGKQHVNILVLGADIAFDGSGAGRSDTIKLVSVDLKNSQMSMMSIPRDTWVEIPGHRRNRINAAYQFGGRYEADRIALAKKTIINLVRDVSGREITIDHYVRIQTGGFVNIVDALGGVELEVEKKMDYEDPSQRLFIHLKPGKQLLDGEQAMGYIRFRHDAEGDYGRIRRQDQFMHALVAKLNGPEMKRRIPKLVAPVMRNLKTDIKESDLLALKHLTDTIGMSGIHTLTLPTVPTRKGRAQVVEVEDRDAAAQTIAELFDGPRPTVVVLNGSGQSGMARTVDQYINADRYNVLGLGTCTKTVPETEIIAVPRSKTQAEKLAQRLGVKTIVTEGDVPEADYGKRTLVPPTSEITVIIGEDYPGVPQETAASGINE